MTFYSHPSALAALTFVGLTFAILIIHELSFFLPISLLGHMIWTPILLPQPVQVMEML